MKFAMQLWDFLFQCKDGKSNSSGKANKENINREIKSKENDEDFIVKVGRIPMRSLPFNVR